MASSSPRQTEDSSTSSAQSTNGSKPPGAKASRSRARNSEPAAGGTSEASEGGEPARGKLRFEGFLPREEAVAYFEAVIEGLRKGTIQFKQGEEQLTLTPGENVDVELKVARKGGRQKVSLELEWRTSDEAHLEIVAG